MAAILSRPQCVNVSFSSWSFLWLVHTCYECSFRALQNHIAEPPRTRTVPRVNWKALAPFIIYCTSITVFTITYFDGEVYSWVSVLMVTVVSSRSKRSMLYYTCIPKYIYLFGPLVISKPLKLARVKRNKVTANTPVWQWVIILITDDKQIQVHGK